MSQTESNRDLHLHQPSVSEILEAIELANPKQLRDNLGTLTRALQARAMTEQEAFK